MLTIDKFKQYFQGIYDNLSESMLDEGLIQYNFQHRWFKQVADFHKNAEVTEDIINIDNNREILTLIQENAIAQDPASPIEIYVQPITLEMLIPNECIEDYLTFIKELTLRYRSKIDTIDNISIVLTLPEGLEADRLDSVHAEQKYMISMTFQVLVYQGALFSNTISVYVNGVRIPFLNLEIGRAMDKRPHLIKNNDIKYFQNTTIQNIILNGYADFSNPELSMLLTNITKNDRFGQLIPFTVYNFKDTEYEHILVDDEFFLDDGAVRFVTGSLATYRLSLVRGTQ